MRLRYMDHLDTDPNMCGDGPGATLKPENLDALAGDSTAHRVASASLMESGNGGEEVNHHVLMANQIDFHCFRCGVYLDSGDAWQTHCPRCQQLAALEAEIGRAVIGYDFVHYALGDKSYEPNLSHAYMLLCMEKANLIARWRELHAEGAEGGE